MFDFDLEDLKVGLICMVDNPPIFFPFTVVVYLQVLDNMDGLQQISTFLSLEYVYISLLFDEIVIL